MFRVHLAEGFPLLSITLKAVLEAQPNVTVSGQSFSPVHLQGQLNADVSCLLLDYDLLKMDLLCFCKQLHKQFPGLRIIVLFTALQNIRFQHIFSYGIHGIILKSATAEEFVQALQDAQQGHFFVHPPIQKQITEIQLFAKTRGQHLVKLSPREQEILELIVAEYTTKEIAKKIFLTEGTVETHRLNIIKKLGVKNTAGIVREAFLRHLVKGGV
jgi:DNA-binding NarL/FixJ family response regulator